MSDINIGALSEAINDKMDRDLNNRSTDSGLRKLVESYVNGTSWYKIFDEIQSDGTIKKWCEQGGKFYNTNTAVSFLKAFSDTSYNLQITTSDPDPTDGIYSTCATNKTITGFTGWIQYGKGRGSNVETDWKAEGYIS